MKKYNYNNIEKYINLIVYIYVCDKMVEQISKDTLSKLQNTIKRYFTDLDYCLTQKDCHTCVFKTEIEGISEGECVKSIGKFVPISDSRGITIICMKALLEDLIRINEK